MTRGRIGVRIEGPRKGRPQIFETIGSSAPGGNFGTGYIPGSGTYFCVRCGAQLSLRETDRLPECGNCGSSSFRRDSIFEARQEHAPATAEMALPTALEAAEWLPRLRASLSEPGHHLAYRDDQGRVQSLHIHRGWTRIGRSDGADICLDDPSVSRRHALLVAEPGKHLHVLDDRSLNGVRVNGKPVEWGPLHDGDELAVGRYRLYALDI